MTGMRIEQGQFAGEYAGRTVLVTGHTGFKGSWLCMWLTALGANVIGYALDPPTDPSAFVSMRLAERMTDVRGDIRDLPHLKSVLEEHTPSVVFHLAAQPLVRLSYAEPHLTYETNIMGTVNVFEAVRAAGSVRAIVTITSDKCYENNEWVYAYRENDAMGGHDPYSSSKGCAELVTSAYRRSFFADPEGAAVASCRAGNIIGGGDWAPDRLIPDCVRALDSGESVVVRNPSAIRPWQHVLDPLAGYLWLGARLLRGERALTGGWNFGPGPTGHVTVADLVEAFVAANGTGSWQACEPVLREGRHEAGTLRLDITKSASVLGWRPVWSTGRAVAQAAAWYRSFGSDEGDPTGETLRQIAEYSAEAASAGLPWTQGTAK